MNGLPAWTLPLIVVALLAPMIAGLLVAGPQGMLLGAILVGAALIVIAARFGRGGRIDVVAGGEGRHHVLIAATGAIDSSDLARRIAQHVDRSAQGSEGEAEVLVVTPALNPMLDHWAADVADARARAGRRLETSLELLSEAGVDAGGSIGDSNPVLAVEDALREFPADEVLVVNGDGREVNVAAELRQRLDRPVTALSATG